MKYFSICESFTNSCFNQRQSLLLSFFPLSLDFQSYLFCFIFGLGIFSLFKQSGKSLLYSLFFSLIFSSFFYFLTNLNWPFVRFYWFPFLVFFTKKISVNFSLTNLALIFLSSLVWILSSSNISLLGLLICLLVFFSNSKLGQGKNLLVVYFYIFAIALSFFLLPNSEFAKYPSDARLSPVSIFNSPPTPYLGPRAEISGIVENNYLSFLKETSVRFLFIIVILFVFLIWDRFFYSKKYKLDLKIKNESSAFIFNFAILSLIPFFLLFPFLFNFRSYFDSSGYRFLMRAVPGVSTEMLLVNELGLILTLMASLFSEFTFRKKSLYILSFSLMALPLGESFLIKKFDNLKDRLSFRYFEHYLDSSNKIVDYTLSNYLFEDYKNSFGFELTRTKPIVHIQPVVISGLVSIGEVSQAVDGKLDTIWNTLKAQKQGDFIELDFRESYNLRAVRLNLGRLVTDFPRSLKIVAFRDDGTLSLNIKIKHWKGPILFTEQGFPYFGNESDVIIDWLREVEVKKIRFEILESAETIFNWSIAEIEWFGDKN